MNILIIGNGRMGKVMKNVAERKGHTCLVVDIDNRNEAEEFNADVIIDFSSQSCLKENLELAERKQTPIIIATTGHNGENLSLIDEYKSKIAIFLASNLSFLFSFMIKIAKLCKKDPELEHILEETHHKHKKDIPSGSAKEIIKVLAANGIIPVVNSYRAGEVVGVHKLIIYNGFESIEIKHEVLNREVFCEGALRACEFISKKKSGVYNMDNLQ